MSNSSPNELEEIAKAAYYINEVAKGVLGSFKIEQDGFDPEDGLRAMHELRTCLLFLREEEGWKDDDRLAMLLPFSHNIRRAVLKKRFPKPIGWRWVTVILATRFGVDCEFTCANRAPA